MTEFTHRTLKSNGLSMHVVEAGEGPLVVCCHGFPECWYSWRHQIKALADAGYRVVAPDQRGYGLTTSPEAIDQYTIFHLAGDIVGLVHALGEHEAVVVGHDWGSPVAWHCALMRPDMFRALVSLSIPITVRGSRPPMQAAREIFGNRFFYQQYFQTPGVAEHELQHDVAKTMRTILFSASGAVNRGSIFDPTDMPPATSYMMERMPDPGRDLPAWLTSEDLEYYTQTFARSGFRGGLNWYRNIDQNWHLTGAFQGKRIERPALFVTGDRDVVPFNEALLDRMYDTVPNLRKPIVLPGIGHWTQQEAADRVNAELVAFLGSL